MATTGRRRQLRLAAPDQEVHTFVNDLERTGGYLPLRTTNVRDDGLLGDRTHPPRSGSRRTGVRQDMAGGRKDRVFADTGRDLEREDAVQRSFEADKVRELKATAERDVTVGGADLAAQAIKAGLVDELHFFVTPV